jgi:hypothetical protein
VRAAGLHRLNEPSDREICKHGEILISPPKATVEQEEVHNFPRRGEILWMSFVSLSPDSVTSPLGSGLCIRHKSFSAACGSPAATERINGIAPGRRTEWDGHGTSLGGFPAAGVVCHAAVDMVLPTRTGPRRTPGWVPA